MRQAFLVLALALRPERLVFVDETGTTLSMTRTHGRAPEGQRVHGSVPRNRGTVTTVLGALCLKGIRAMMAIEGGTTSEVFEAFVRHVLVPALKPGDIVVLDNLGAHKPDSTLQLIRDAGAHVLFLPPYSPDFSPIELAWAKLKKLLRDFAARTHQQLDEALDLAAHLITPEDCAGYFRHCGYPAAGIN